MEFIDITFLKIMGALVLVILVNIIIGSTDALLARRFDKTKFVNGLIKGLIAASSIFLLYIAGLLIPNITIMQIDGQDVTLIMALSMLLITSVLFYGKEDLTNLGKFIMTKFGGNNNNPEGTNTTIVNNYFEEVRPVQKTFTEVRAGDRGEEPPSKKV